LRNETYPGQGDRPVARTLVIIGDCWTMLIIGDILKQMRKLW